MVRRAAMVGFRMSGLLKSYSFQRPLRGDDWGTVAALPRLVADGRGDDGGGFSGSHSGGPG